MPCSAVCSCLCKGKGTFERRGDRGARPNRGDRASILLASGAQLCTRELEARGNDLSDASRKMLPRLLQYYAASEAETVYSVGDLTYFTAENKPEGAAARCADCKYIDTCPYSAEYVYIKRWKECGRPKDDWPFNIIAPAPNTEENLREAYNKGPYGRCVFACDNDVVDHQTVSIRFRNNVKAQLIMTAFTYDSGRRMYFHGTDGEIKLDEAKDTLLVERFGQPIQEFKISDIVTETMKDSFGHGGGDYGTVDAFYELLCGQDKTETSLEKSAESHFISYAAEESRNKGVVVQMSEFR